MVEELLERLEKAPEEERSRILGGDELDSMAYRLVQEHGAGQEAAEARPATTRHQSARI